MRTRDALFLILFLGAMLLVILLHLNEDRNKQKMRERELRELAGYPATEESLQDMHIYWVNVAIVEEYTDHKEFLALLRETEIKARNDYRLKGTNRLFKLHTNLATRGYYKFMRTDEPPRYGFRRIADPEPR